MPVADALHAEMRRLLIPVAAGDDELLGFLIDWSHFIRKDLRGIPLVVPVGGLVVVETPSRKNAGAHYTPRSLAEEVVKYVLEPLVYKPGPLQINDENAWKLKSSTAILDLKVADIAAGSGAFLVAAARFLASRVTEAWTEEAALSRDEQANPRLANDRAIREVIARCLYGADINPMAVEMCKLSLWLVSMDRNKPFSFVDDKIFCGNSLLGITTLDQLRALHIYPDPKRGRDLLHELVDVDGKIAEATRLRKELASPVDEHNPMRSTRGKLALLAQAHQTTSDLHVIADAIISTGLSLGGKPGAKLDDAYRVLRWQLAQAFPGGGSDGDSTVVNRLIDAGLTPTVHSDFERWQPLHWVLEAPNVFVTGCGFDAIVGNPPFLVAKRVSGAIGSNMREWSAMVTGKGVTGKTDLAAYFLLRGIDLLGDRATLGCIFPDAIREGSTRRVGLSQAVDRGYIYRSSRTTEWPTVSANTRISKVWWTRVQPEALVSADDIQTKLIGSALDPVGGASEQRPKRLENLTAIEGSVFLGDGFLLSIEEAQDLLARDSRNSAVVRPYLNGRAAMDSLPPQSNTWIVDFREMPESIARQFPLPWKIVEDRVRPERMDKDVKKYPRMVNEWWKHWNARPDLYVRLAKLDEVSALAVVSKHGFPVRVPTNVVLSSALIVFPIESFGLYAVLASSWHRIWLEQWGSTMGSRLRYAIGDIWQTFPMPELTNELEDAGKQLWDSVVSAGTSIEGGVTAVMNMVNSMQVATAGPVRNALKRVDLLLGHSYGCIPGGDYGLVQLRSSNRWLPLDSRELLDCLLQENHQRSSLVE